MVRIINRVMKSLYKLHNRYRTLNFTQISFYAIISPMFNIIAIALGGALGALSRYGVMCLAPVGFPFGTLAVNMIGSFLLGGILELSALKLTLTEPMKLFLVVGFCGAFTTFSTFSMDTAYLMQKGDLFKVFLYMLCSLVLSIGAFLSAIALVRHFS